VCRWALAAAPKADQCAVPGVGMAHFICLAYLTVSWNVGAAGALTALKRVGGVSGVKHNKTSFPDCEYCHRPSANVFCYYSGKTPHDGNQHGTHLGCLIRSKWRLWDLTIDAGVGHVAFCGICPDCQVTPGFPKRFDDEDNWVRFAIEGADANDAMDNKTDRPSVAAASASAAVSQASDLSEQPIKRKRGRPRKNPLPTAAIPSAPIVVDGGEGGGGGGGGSLQNEPLSLPQIETTLSVMEGILLGHPHPDQFGPKTRLVYDSFMTSIVTTSPPDSKAVKAAAAAEEVGSVIVVELERPPIAPVPVAAVPVAAVPVAVAASAPAAVAVSEASQPGPVSPEYELQSPVRRAEPSPAQAQAPVQAQEQPNEAKDDPMNIDAGNEEAEPTEVVKTKKRRRTELDELATPFLATPQVKGKGKKPTKSEKQRKSKRARK
jgi:hypothetical protein